MKSLTESYEDWVKRHPCPKCGAEAMDFTINCDSPYICMTCRTHFGFIEKEMEQFENHEPSEVALDERN